MMHLEDPDVDLQDSRSGMGGGGGARTASICLRVGKDGGHL